MNFSWAIKFGRNLKLELVYSNVKMRVMLEEKRGRASTILLRHRLWRSFEYIALSQELVLRRDCVSFSSILLGALRPRFAQAVQAVPAILY